MSMIQAANVGLGIVGKVRGDKGSTYTVDVTVILNHCRKGNRLLWQQISPSLNSDTSADSLSGTAGTGMTYPLHYLLPHSQSYLSPTPPVQLQEICQSQSVCDPQRSHHLCHAGHYVMGCIMCILLYEAWLICSRTSYIRHKGHNTKYSQ